MRGDRAGRRRRPRLGSQHLRLRPPRRAGGVLRAPHALRRAQDGRRRRAAGRRGEPFRRSLAAHAAAALSPEDLIPVEHVDAVVPGGDLGLELAEDLELLRPFGMGNPQPTLLVPAARFERVTGDGRGEGALALHAGHGGRRALARCRLRLPAAGAGPGRRACARIALRLERNRWNGIVEPRVILRALCPTRPGEIERPRGRAEPSGTSSAWRSTGAAATSRRRPRNRRGPPREGFAGVAGDLFSSGEPVLVAVADVPRRRAGLQAVVAGLSDGPMPVISWRRWRRTPSWLPPSSTWSRSPAPRRHRRPAPQRDAASAPRLGPSRGRLRDRRLPGRFDLRPQLADLYRALREVPADAPPRTWRPRSRDRPLSARGRRLRAATDRARPSSG